MKNKVSVITLLFLLAPLLLSAQNLKVGIMNPDRVMDSIPEADEIQQELERYIDQQEEQFIEHYSNWMDALGSFQRRVERGDLSESEQEVENERLIEMEEELEALQQRIQRQIQNRQNELINPVMVRIEEAMEEAADEYGLDFVLNKQTSRGDPLVYYASERGVDITDRVIEIMTAN